MKAAGYKENGHQTLYLDQEDPEGGTQDNVSTDHRGEPLVRSNSQVSEAVKAQGYQFCRIFQEKTWNSELFIWNFNLYVLALHWADQTKQSGGHMQSWAHRTTSNKIISTSSPAWATKSKMDFISRLRSKHCHSQNSCRMIYIFWSYFFFFF